MHPLHGMPIYELAKHLEEEPSKKIAWQIIKTFYEGFDKENVADSMWHMVTITMQADNEHVEGKDRSNILFFYEYWKILNEAVAFLNEERKK